MRHPIQPLIMDKHSIVRFMPNRLVNYMFDVTTDMHGYDFTSDYSASEQEQLAQLTGVSLKMFRNLPYVSPETIAVADAMYREKISEDMSRIRWLENRVKELENQIETAT